MQKQVKQLILNKNGQRYIFRYDTGSEDSLLELLCDYAGNPELDLDFFDASVLGYKLTKNLVDQAEKLVNKNSPRQTSFLS
jgi:hypothetical protein